MNPLVSVVITTYHGVDTIGRAVESVLRQTYRPIEIIVVDDNGLGTEDQQATRQIVEGMNADIVYIAHEQNINGSAARNTGLRRARGKYVALLDDDDLFRPNKLTLQVEALEKADGEYALCYTSMEIHYPNGKSRIEQQDRQGYLFEPVMLRQIAGQTSTLMVDREAALSVNGFDESFRRHQDWEFLDRMAYLYKIAVVPQVCIDRYIVRRTTAKTPEEFERNRLFYLDKMEKYIRDLSLPAQKALYRHHYRSICKEYLKARNLGKAVQYFAKCGNPFRTMLELIEDYRNSSLT